MTTFDEAKIAEWKADANIMKQHGLPLSGFMPDDVLALLSALEDARRNAHEQAALVAQYIEKRDTALAERDEARRDNARLEAHAENTDAIIQKSKDLRLAAIARAEQADAENKRLVEALTPSAETKAAYIGDFSFPIEIEGEDEDGFPEPVVIKVTVPWTTTKEIMAAILARAALQGASPNAD